MYQPVSRTNDIHLDVPYSTSHLDVEGLKINPIHSRDKYEEDRTALSGSDPVLTKERGFLVGKSTSSWSRYNIFTSHGRNRAYRKLLSSGPAVDGVSSPRTTLSSGFFSRYTGWRMGTLACLCAVSLCLVIEAILLLSALSLSVGAFGSGLLYKGSCSKVKSLTVWLFLPLNIAATVLISTSNYVMQVMAAPDREEVDYAHSLATSITIAGMRFRNLQFGGLRRRVIWWILGVSSLPIHVLLNSAIYGSVQATDSGVLIVSDEFETDTDWQSCRSRFPTDIQTDAFACSLMQDFYAGKTVKLSPQKCFNQYSNGFQTNASSVIVVTKPSSRHYFSLPAPGSIGIVGSERGICCVQNNTGNNFIEISASERRYMLDFDPSSGNADAYIPFMVECGNSTQKVNNKTELVISAGQDGPSLYSASSALFVTSQTPLLNVSSFRSAFSAAEYRYWATAELLGYNLDSQDLTFADQGWDTRAWLCPRDDLAQGIECDPTQLEVTMKEWLITSSSIPVKKCHVLPIKEQCALRYSTAILGTALVTDLIKLAAMLIALRLTTQPLATIGDAIESFLRRPDVYTKECCLLDGDCARQWSTKAAPLVKEEALRVAMSKVPGYNNKSKYSSIQPRWGGRIWSSVMPPKLKESWTATRTKWFVVPSRSRWVCYICFFASLAVPTIFIFVNGVKSLKKQRVANFWSVGLYGPDPNALFTGGILNIGGILWVSVLINLPQLLFSMLYFLFNAMITMMHTSHEWAMFATSRKALRVSSPKGQQRSTYWLQLPLRYSIPLIVASGSLHWLLGRSIYIVKVDVYGFFGDRQSEKDFFACGYSPLTLLGLVVVLSGMILSLAALSMRRLGSGSPVVKLNSLAIAAACHRKFEDEDMVTMPLMWGVVRDDTGKDTTHCSFSAREVSPLVEGQIYH